MEKINACDDGCPVKKSLNILGGKWTLLILYQINDRVIRYGALKRQITGISEKMLIQELNRLIASDLVSKKVYPEIPPKVEYRLTEKGLQSLLIVEQLELFALENLT